MQKQPKKLGYHPLDYYGNRWRFLKYLFLILVIFGIIWDVVGPDPPFNNPDRCLQLTRIILALVCISLFVIFQVLELRWFNLKDFSEDDQGIPDTISDKVWKVVFDQTKYCSNLYQRRINFMLVAESMLIVSFVTTLVVPLDNIKLFEFAESIRIGIAILGLVFTFSWYYINKRLDWRLVFLNHRFLKKTCSYSSMYKDYLKAPDPFARINSGFFTANILPTFTFALWYFLLYITRW
ncbi:MAG: hypothetical protein JSW60_03270 [Thermoplasmatales archaeon]|nr:MAG: hypothetical protein JSW60_03270 [Thermoplasmatales archaeon]